MAKKFQTLNIGAATIELAEYEVGGKGALTLVNYGVAPLEAPLDGGNAETILTPAIMGIVRERGIRPGEIAVSVSGQMVFPRLAAIAKAGGDEKFEQMVRFEIEQNIPFPIDEMVCDRQILGDTENGDKSVLIVAAKVDQIEAVTSAVSAAGFKPVLVDAAPLALTNALKLCRPGDDCVILLDIGAKTTSLAIVEGDRIYNRSIPVAGNAITREIVSALGCSPDEAERFKVERGYVSLGGVTEDEDEVADRVSKVCRNVLARLHAEITRSINFYRSQQGGSMPTRLYLTGGTALLPQLDVFFAESLGIEVEFFNPFEAVGVGSRVDASALESDGARIAATVGLALHLAGSARFAINLLPPSIVEERAERAKVPVLAGAGVALVAALAFVVLAVNWQAAAVKDSTEEISANAETLQALDQRVQKAVKDMAAAEADAGALRDFLQNRVTAIRRLGAVCKVLDGRPGMWIDKWNGSGVTFRYWADRVKGSAGKSVSDSVEAAIRGSDPAVIDAESVKTTSMSEIGKGQIKQFTVEFKGK